MTMLCPMCCEPMSEEGVPYDCYWFFKRLLETGDDPVFIFSELMKRRTGNNDNLLNHELI